MSDKAAFHRNDGVETACNNVRMPESFMGSQTVSMTIGEVIGHYEAFLNEKDYGPEVYPWATRFVMGFPLPSWQRPLVWTDEQKIRFITSVWAGVSIGSYMVNDVYDFVDAEKPYYRELSGVLIDGQQRLSSIEGYLNNQFSVPDAEGNPVFWKDLPRIERRRFSGFHFYERHMTCVHSAVRPTPKANAPASK